MAVSNQTSSRKGALRRRSSRTSAAAATNSPIAAAYQPGPMRSVAMNGNGRAVKRGVVTTHMAQANHTARTASVSASWTTEMRRSRTRAEIRPTVASQQAGDSYPNVSERWAGAMLTVHGDRRDAITETTTSKSSTVRISAGSKRKVLVRMLDK